MKTYFVRYRQPVPMYVYGDGGKLEFRDELTLEVTAPNKMEARKKFNEIYYGIWHNDYNHRAINIRIENKK